MISYNEKSYKKKILTKKIFFSIFIKYSSWWSKKCKSCFSSAITCKMTIKSSLHINLIKNTKIKQKKCLVSDLNVLSHQTSIKFNDTSHGVAWWTRRRLVDLFPIDVARSMKDWQRDYFIAARISKLNLCKYRIKFWKHKPTL